MRDLPAPRARAPALPQGIDLIRDNYDWLMSEGVQLIMLGSGREDLENDLRNMENRCVCVQPGM